MILLLLREGREVYDFLVGLIIVRSTDFLNLLRLSHMRENIERKYGLIDVLITSNWYN